mmetsp:Transcript_36867/g.86109  ORF Transcript_36867/g.86109 Transcript_36867/m.86109 type:complete len:186 (-) Transcript_36867:203-760(-)
MSASLTSRILARRSPCLARSADLTVVRAAASRTFSTEAPSFATADPPRFRRQIQEAISSKEYYSGLRYDQDRLPCGIRTRDIRYKLWHLPMGGVAPHIQAGEHKVVLKIYMRDMTCLADDFERAALLQLVGPRFSTLRDELTLVSEKFPSRIENKRYLEILLDTLVVSAKTLAEEQRHEDASVSA